MENNSNINITLSTIIRIAAFLLPMYFVFYGPLHYYPEGKNSNVLWKYIFAGFIFYIAAAISAILLFK